VQYSQSGTFLFVTDLVGNGGTDTLSEVERVIFNDDVIFV
jgi:hypothetical protein